MNVQAIANREEWLDKKQYKTERAQSFNVGQGGVIAPLAQCPYGTDHALHLYDLGKPYLCNENRLYLTGTTS